MSPVTPKPIDLTQRQELVLGLVVREYSRAATPVSSKALVEDFDLGVSSATIRNDLARLEELGLLTHPHTSAGRVPTHHGYRYYVEHLMADRQLSLGELRRIDHQFHQLGLELHQWLQLTAAVLADTVQSAAIVTAPRARQARVKHLQLVNTYGSALLLVLVLRDGSVRQRSMFAPEPMSQEVLARLSKRLSAAWSGKNADEVSNWLPLATTAFEHSVAEQVVLQLQDASRSGDAQAYRDGFRHLLAQPEFTDAGAVDRAFRVLEGDWLTTRAMDGTAGNRGVSVIIGQGCDGTALDDFGLVLSQYGAAPELVGALGVLGPVRMQYERVIPAVRHMATLLSDLVRSLFGPGDGSTNGTRQTEEVISDF